DHRQALPCAVSGAGRECARGGTRSRADRRARRLRDLALHPRPRQLRPSHLQRARAAGCADCRPARRNERARAGRGAAAGAVSGMRAGLARVLRREVAAWKADRLMPWLLSVLPLAGVVLVLAIFAGRVSTDLPVAVVDRDDSAASRALVARLDATAGMRVA